MKKRAIYCWSDKNNLSVGEKLNVKYKENHIWRGEENLGELFTACPHAFSGPSTPKMEPYLIENLKDGDILRIYVEEVAPVNNFKDGALCLLSTYQKNKRGPKRPKKSFSPVYLPLFLSGIALLINGVALIIMGLSLLIK